ncbi:hypothetical protein EDC04DRAFT_2722142 [Pisolithus marmoratus]|nr:hypothetical protein EDC04DRAFT_2722142 [Pisolithus marmoratus]
MSAGTLNESRQPTPQPTYASLFGISGPVPRWLPISFLAISSAALVVPIVMLRRYKAGLRATTTAAPPRRRSGTVVIPGSRTLPVGQPVAPPPRIRLRTDTPFSSQRLPPNQGSQTSSYSTPLSRTRSNAGAVMVSEAQDSFNGPLYSLKALAIATTIVAASASASVFGVMTYFDVHDTSDFATRMRLWVTTTFPFLSGRIHRQPEAKDLEALTPLFPSKHANGLSDFPPPQPSSPSSLTLSSSPEMPAQPHDTSPPYDAAEPQTRLQAAYDRGGFHALVEAALRELEAEAETERVRRAAMAAANVARPGLGKNEK